MRPLKLCLIGAGRVTNHYHKILNPFIESEDIAVVSVVDTDEKRAKSMSLRFGAKAYADADSALSDDFDLAVILTPSGTHEACASQLLSVGKHVLCEKPIGLVVEKVEENILLAQKDGLQYGGVFQNRYNKAIDYTRDVIAKGKLGEIVSASIRLHWCRFQEYYEDGWHGTWAMDGGVINQQAIHHIDALFYILGGPVKVSGLFGRRVNSLEAEDTFVGCGELSCGAFFTLEATTAARPVDIEASITILGDLGFIKIGGIAINKIEKALIRGVDMSEEERLSHSAEVDNGYGDGHSALFREIIGHWKTKGELRLPLSASESLKTVKYVHAFYSAAENSRQVVLSDEPRSKNLGVQRA